MGLLEGAGRRLKGLFADGGLIDTLEEAQAWLDGDYERGKALSARNRRRGRRPVAPEEGKDISRKGDFAPPPQARLHEAWHRPPRFRDY